MLGGPRQGRDYEHRFPARSDSDRSSALRGAAEQPHLGHPVHHTRPRTAASRASPGVQPASSHPPDPLVAAPVPRFGRRHRHRQPRLARPAGSCPRQGGANDSHKLLLAALQIWLTNIIVFGLAYWELDRGGPVQRAKLSRSRAAPCRLPVLPGRRRRRRRRSSRLSSGRVDWAPVFVDYLYVSVTNSSAFSPTDTMPLSSRAKLLMSIQAISALIVSLLVIAKAVGGLK